MSKKLDGKLIEIFEVHNAQVVLLKEAKALVQEVMKLGTKGQKLIEQADKLAEREGFPRDLAEGIQEAEMDPLDDLDQVADALFEDMPAAVATSKLPGKLRKVYAYIEDDSEDDY